MKELTEEELLELLNAKVEGQITYEMVKSPNYEAWGRAREWEYHQGICLIAGVAPVSKACFECLLQEDSSPDLEHLLHHYPIKKTDRTRLKNLESLIKTLPGLLDIKAGKRNMRPSIVLVVCRDHRVIGPNIPQALIDVVHKIGPHPSLDLPKIFSSLEINVSLSPIQICLPIVTGEIPLEGFLSYNLKSLDKEQTARMLVRLIARQLWKDKPYLNLKTMKSQPLIIQALSLGMALEKRTQEYAEKTIDGWIRDLNPNYKPDSRKGPKKTKKNSS